ncbi:MAG: hypothetical protein Q6K17_08330, partial [Gloeomargarita sp. GMQP_bins_5]
PGREQPPAVQHPGLRRPAAAVDHQPVLRARRLAAVRQRPRLPRRRPRQRRRLQNDPHYYHLRNHILEFLYERFAHHD